MGQVRSISKFVSKWRRLSLGCVLFGIVLLAAAPAFSQGCSLCYTQAASSGSRMIQALKSGILILVVPPTLGSIGLVVLVHRKRNQVRNNQTGEINHESSPNDGEDW